MKLVQLFFYYLRWHYSRAFVDIWRIYTNVLWLIFNFFSIAVLAKTLFAPWRRLKEEGQGKSKIGTFFSKLLINTIMRVIGFAIRVMTILAGLVVLAGVAVAGLFFYPLWLLAPLILVMLLLFGLTSFIKSV